VSREICDLVEIRGCFVENLRYNNAETREPARPAAQNGATKNMFEESYRGVHQSPEESINETARFLSMSIKAVDLVLVEDGYALRHPELLATFMQTALFDYHAGRFGEILEYIKDALQTMEEDIESKAQ
jgi:hypothetical protein